MFRVLEFLRCLVSSKSKKKGNLKTIVSSFVVQIIGGGKEGTQRKRSLSLSLSLSVALVSVFFLCIVASRRERRKKKKKKKKKKKSFFFFPKTNSFGNHRLGFR